MTIFAFWAGVAVGGAAVWFFPKAKAWFVGEAAKIKEKL